MNIKPLPEETIGGASRAIRSRERSCLEALEACLARIDEHEARCRAWVSVDRVGALRRAAELDNELAAGHWRGPLHGIPIGIKDIIDVAGWPTEAGAEWFATEWVTISQATGIRPKPLPGGEAADRKSVV